MNFKNLFSFVVITVVIATALTACQRHSFTNLGGDSGAFQCISATIMLAGKPTTTVIEWNTRTGAAQILDSMVVASKATGVQSIVVGWIPLSDLQSTIQEIMNRNQAVQQQVAPVSQNVAPSSVREAPAKKRK